MDTIFNEDNFINRIKNSISLAWIIFQHKNSNDLIKIGKEASMQLQYAYILQTIIPLIIYEKDEKIEIELEKPINLKNGKNCNIDVFVTGVKNDSLYTVAIEMKCYRKFVFTGSGNLRSAHDIFMKDVYVDIEKLESYISDGICNDAKFILLTDDKYLVHPQIKKGKCWDYDTSDGYHLLPSNITTPIGGKKQSITIKNEYFFNWIKKGEFYYLEL